MSDTGSALYSALAEFQKECPKIELDKTVSTKKYNFKYASLQNIIAKTKPVLAKHGLTIIQSPCDAPDGLIAIQTTLCHKSGETHASIFTMTVPSSNKYVDGKPVETYTPQDFGSAISYARRYSYSSVLGIVTEEDTDAIPLGDQYQDSPMDKQWLKQVCEEIGVTDKNTMKELHEKLLRKHATKEVSIVKKLLD